MTAKHVILISIDNLRFDCVGYQPDKRELAKYDVLKYLETPTLDRIAERSLCFTQCTSTNTYTTAAHASMLTGLYPPRHGVRGFYDKKLSPDVFTIAEILKVYGYETVMMTDTENLFVPVELNRGFDHFFHIDDEGLLRFLSQSRGKNLFVFAHLYDVHEPFLLSKHPKYVTDEYVATVESLYRRFNLAMETVGERDFKTYRRLWMRLLDRIGFKSHELFFPLYVQGVSRFDQGRLRAFMDGIESLGLLDDALMVVVSDHGEGKSDPSNPDHFTHGIRLYDSVIRVPLMLYHRDVSPRLVDKAVSIVDIAPTILRLAIGDGRGETLPYALDGCVLDAAGGRDDRAVYSETLVRDDNRTLTAPPVFLSYFVDQRAVRTTARKYVICGEPEIVEKGDILRGASDEVFAQSLCRALLCRFEGYGEYLGTLRRLRKGSATRADVVRDILRSREYRAKPHYLAWDLRADPFEERAVVIPAPLPDSGTGKAYFETIQRISAHPVTSEPILPGSRELIISVMKKAYEEGWEEKAEPFLNNMHLLTCLIDEFLNSRKMTDMARNRKHVESIVLSSEAFTLFLREKIPAMFREPSLLRKVLTGLTRGLTSHVVHYKRAAVIHRKFMRLISVLRRADSVR